MVGRAFQPSKQASEHLTGRPGSAPVMHASSLLLTLAHPTPALARPCSWIDFVNFLLITLTKYGQLLSIVGCSPIAVMPLPGRHPRACGRLHSLAKEVSSPLQTLPPQRSELDLTLLSQLSIVVQMSGFASSLAHSGVLLKVSIWLRSRFPGRQAGRQAGTAGASTDGPGPQGAPLQER